MQSFCLSLSASKRLQIKRVGSRKHSTEDKNKTEECRSALRKVITIDQEIANLQYK